MRRAVLCVKILVLCLVAASLAGVAAAARDDAEKLWGQGEKAYNDGRYREALSYYEGSLNLCGEDLECAASDLNGIGAVYEKYLSCNEAIYRSCSDTYPEIIFAIAF